MAQDHTWWDSNIWLEKIISDALADHDGNVSFGGRVKVNLRLADDFGAIAGEQKESKD